MDDSKPNRQDEAAAWFAAQRAGVMLAEQRAQFDQWRADPRNQAALDAMHELWGELAVLKDRAPPPKRVGRWRRVIAAAAALAFAALVAWTWLMMSGGDVIRTADGEQKSQSLPDGSLVMLNVASDVTYAIDEKQRVVKIGDGEAAFVVKGDKARPFVVAVGDFELRAIGTTFNVRRREGAIEVSVAEGRVAVCSATGVDAGSILQQVEAGQRLIFASKRPSGAFSPRQDQIEPAQVSEWRMRIVTYEDASVSDVVEDLNRYFEAKLRVEGSDLADQRVTIRLQVEDREKAVETLAALLGARFMTAGGEDVLMR